jgi:hypothetical protein
LKGSLLGNETAAKLKGSLLQAETPPEATADTEAPAIEEGPKPLDVAEYDEQLDQQTVIDKLENDRVVKRAPTLLEIATDPARTNVITHYVSHEDLSTHADEYTPTRELTEHESVAELVGFLEEVIDLGEKASSTDIARAQDMLENITFIGEKERQEAMKGIAEHWKGWLGENPDRQLCVLASISPSGGKNKSDRFLLDGILANFSDEELSALDGRLVSQVNQLASAPADTRIVLIDDWTISGSQMESAYAYVVHEAGEYADSIEIQLVTSTAERVQKGKTVSRNGRMKTIPVRSYFLSHEAEVATGHASKGHSAYETGSHSSVDFDFQDEISSLKHRLEDADDTARVMPAATNIRRDYKNAKLLNIERLAASRKSKVPVGVGAESGGER